ncbi:MAG: hypothetical protein M0Z67_12780 [Nitrospiraceae bacterium]|nr:hypothetical protein [Nitrospiraceae bacterium]
MPKIEVAKIVPGMKLSRTVRNESGMVLLGEGTELTESLIARLAAMNIGSVHVEMPGMPEKAKTELLGELDERFRKTEDEPLMGLLKKIVSEQIEKPDD